MSEEDVQLDQLLTVLVDALAKERGEIATAELLRRQAKRMIAKARRGANAETEQAQMKLGKRGRGRPVANNLRLALLSVGRSQAEAAAALTDKEDHRRAMAQAISRARQRYLHLLLPFIGFVHSYADSAGITFEEALRRFQADLAGKQTWRAAAQQMPAQKATIVVAAATS